MTYGFSKLTIQYFHALVNALSHVHSTSSPCDVLFVFQNPYLVSPLLWNLPWLTFPDTKLMNRVHYSLFCTNLVSLALFYQHGYCHFSSYWMFIYHVKHVLFKDYNFKKWERITKQDSEVLASALLLVNLQDDLRQINCLAILERIINTFTGCFWECDVS